MTKARKAKYKAALELVKTGGICIDLPAGSAKEIEKTILRALRKCLYQPQKPR